MDKQFQNFIRVLGLWVKLPSGMTDQTEELSAAASSKRAHLIDQKKKRCIWSTVTAYLILRATAYDHCQYCVHTHSSNGIVHSAGIEVYLEWNMTNPILDDRFSCRNTYSYG